MYKVLIKFTLSSRLTKETSPKQQTTRKEKVEQISLEQPINNHMHCKAEKIVTVIQVYLNYVH
jgi:hypothetical protein